MLQCHVRQSTLQCDSHAPHASSVLIISPPSQSGVISSSDRCYPFSFTSSNKYIVCCCYLAFTESSQRLPELSTGPSPHYNVITCPDILTFTECCELTSEGRDLWSTCKECIVHILGSLNIYLAVPCVAAGRSTGLCISSNNS